MSGGPRLRRALAAVVLAAVALVGIGWSDTVSRAVATLPERALGGEDEVASRTEVRVPRRVVGVPEREAFVPLFVAAADEFGVDVELLMAVAWQESRWNPVAVSHRGAMGLGQLMPIAVEDAHTRLLDDDDLDGERLQPFEPADNLRMSAAILADLLDRHDRETALAMYHQGERSFRRFGGFASSVRYVANVEAHLRRAVPLALDT